MPVLCGCLKRSTAPTITDTIASKMIIWLTLAMSRDQNVWPQRFVEFRIEFRPIFVFALTRHGARGAERPI